MPSRLGKRKGRSHYEEHETDEYADCGASRSVLPHNSVPRLGCLWRRLIELGCKCQLGCQFSCELQHGGELERICERKLCCDYG